VSSPATEGLSLSQRGPCYCKAPQPDPTKTDFGGKAFGCRSCGYAIVPISCSEQRRMCKNPMQWVVESGTYNGGHSMSSSCQQHLGSTVACAALYGEFVRVAPAGMSPETKQAMRDSFDPTGEFAAKLAESKVAAR
jgi:hypothetical protein